MQQGKLNNEYYNITVNSHGAELQSIYSNKDNIELLWQADKSFWPRHAPILFPIVGRLRNDTMFHQGKSYKMTQHGFARDKAFELYSHSEEILQFRLQSNETTLGSFPFDFELLIDYALLGATLRTVYTIRNSTDKDLPASIGGHPAFNWPLNPSISKDAHFIEFDREETHPIRQLKDGLIRHETLSSPVINKKLALSDELFLHDALIFDQINSQKVYYRAGDKQSLCVSFEDFPNFGIWTKPGAGFVCLEPWYGFSDSTEGENEFVDKPGILTIPSYSEISLSFDIIYNTI